MSWSARDLNWVRCLSTDVVIPDRRVLSRDRVLWCGVALNCSALTCLKGQPDNLRVWREDERILGKQRPLLWDSLSCSSRLFRAKAPGLTWNTWFLLRSRNYRLGSAFRSFLPTISILLSYR